MLLLYTVHVTAFSIGSRFSGHGVCLFESIDNYRAQLSVITISSGSIVANGFRRTNAVRWVWREQNETTHVGLRYVYSGKCYSLWPFVGDSDAENG